MATKKERDIMKEPLDKKPVSCLPSVGRLLATNLQAQGYRYAEDIYRVFRNYKDRKKKFQKWMKVTANAPNSQSSKCYEYLKRYDEEFGEIESQSVPRQKNSAKGNLKGCGRKNGGAAKNKGVQFKNVKVAKAEAEAIDSSENSDTGSKVIPQYNIRETAENVTKSDPITSFFLTTLETVKTFPRSLQLQVKRQFFEIMINAEDRLVENETEPVASTSHCSPRCSLTPQSSTPVLNNFQRDDRTTSTPILNNIQRDNTIISTPTLNNIQREDTTTSTPIFNNIQPDDRVTSTPILSNILPDDSATSTPILNNIQSDNRATASPMLNNIQPDDRGTFSPVLDNIQRDITATSTPALNNFQQSNTERLPPTGLNYFTVNIKQEKLDDNDPEVSTSEEQPIFAPNCGYRVDADETIIID